MFDIFETLIVLILVYGSDVWGTRNDGLWPLDEVFLHFVRCILGIKATTSNIIVTGECGRLPPSNQCTIHALCYMNRMMYTNEGSLVKQVYHELRSLHDQWFNTWITKMHKLADDYQMNLSQDPAKFHHNWKTVVRTNHIKTWEAIRPIWIAIRFWERRYIQWSFVLCLFLRLPVFNCHTYSAFHGMYIESGCLRFVLKILRPFMC